MIGDKYRHEWKHELNHAQMMAIRSRVSAVLLKDSHTIDGKYIIRSLYFDNDNDKALREKIDGVNMREKFRIRYYNGDTSLIHLEKKSKLNGLGTKFSADLSAEQAERIVNGDISWMMDSDNDLIKELYCKMRYQGMKPMTIVDYTREPFIYGPGNVRVTFDYDIRTGIKCTDFLNTECVTVPAGDTPIILEVKWDAYLPGIIKDLIQEPNVRAGSFSKYAQCRVYG
ncbi:MAG: polyphosphate polymerase domain-containing protein [Lachnospiraceae bacterium]|nr:polyphosphate polymerase domain-containing protein [Lachnospiraceae bacterium]